MGSLAFTTIHHFCTSILNLLYPPRCVGCNELGAWLCQQCVRQTPRVEPPFCLQCGASVEVPSSELCLRCRTLAHQIPRIRAVFYFEGAIREAIHRFKYDGVTALAQPLGYLMADHWLTHPTQSDIIVPVPLHPQRRGKRGFNQAALLAKELSERVDLATDATTLVRHRATASQVGLDVEQRKHNVQDAFRCATDRLANKRVLLIDDVCTTGSTLEACALALREGGVHSVEALTLARAHSKKDWGTFTG